MGWVNGFSVAFMVSTALVGCARPGTDQSTGTGECFLAEQDIVEIESANREYVDAWLANDSSRVGALLHDDVIMIPHHGVMPRIGKEAVMSWWFPTEEITAPVTKYDIEINGVEGCHDIAISYGRLNKLEYQYEGKTYSNENGNFMTVFRKNQQGQWKIAYRIWNDPITEIE